MSGAVSSAALRLASHAPAEGIGHTGGFRSWYALKTAYAVDLFDGRLWQPRLRHICIAAGCVGAVTL
jgi:hypothetical protein